MKDQSVRTFRDLDAWNVAMDLVIAVYELALELPSIERYELSSQIRRAATSVPSNIAEGQASGRNGIFLRHIGIALGSIGELDTQFEIALRLRFLEEPKVLAIHDHISRTRQLLYGLRRSVRLRLLKSASPALVVVAVAVLWTLLPLLR